MSENFVFHSKKNGSWLRKILLIANLSCVHRKNFGKQYPCLGQAGKWAVEIVHIEQWKLLMILSQSLKSPGRLIRHAVYQDAISSPPEEIPMNPDNTGVWITNQFCTITSRRIMCFWKWGGNECMLVAMADKQIEKSKCPNTKSLCVFWNCWNAQMDNFPSSAIERNVHGWRYISA